MSQSGHNKILAYKPIDTNHQKHSKLKRKIRWFNLPFSQYVSKKIGKSFLTMSDLHFPKNHIYISIFNSNQIKVSYSCIQCVQNIKSILNKHKSVSGTYLTFFHDYPHPSLDCRPYIRKKVLPNGF